MVQRGFTDKTYLSLGLLSSLTFSSHIIHMFILLTYKQRTSDSLNEGLPIKMIREKFQRK